MTKKNCCRCGNEIPAARLEAMPETEICVVCSAQIGGEFDYTFTVENTAKAGSMKHNYGGVDIQKKRKTIRPLFRPPTS